jgi:DNA helicase-2/ATP-dependent DNA helicase PcrA
MEQFAELQAEREYAARVQALLLAVIEQSDIISGSHSESIRAIISDAWEDLRMRPTALSPYDIEQLSAEIERFVVRKTFTDEQARRYRRMLLNPFFARIDFTEEGESELEKIVIGLYSLKSEKGEIMVHDWRAPVCGLFYDAMPGKCEYLSPSGAIRGEMTLKRQYKMKDGKLAYYVDTQVSIDDELLLDLLSGATSRHMHEIVSTIQAEQNAAIRADASKVVSVVGAAGSGKTSVAMHRAAYIMYRRRDVMEPSRIQILSPSNAFSEYISNVLPELGEENIKARTLHEIVESILERKCEAPLQQLTHLLDAGGELRRQSVAYKTGARFMEELDKYIESFTTFGPDFANVWFEGKLMIRREELRRMYKDEFKILTPAQRLIRVSATLDTRFESWEKAMYQQYEKQYAGKYRGRELQLVCRMAVSQRLQPLRFQLRSMLDVKGDLLLKAALRTAPRPLKEALNDNIAAGVLWWEDAVAEAYMLVKLGFRQPDKTIYHLLIDEAQDYQDTALKLLSAHFPRAKVTLLGDPMQRTCPAMEECDPGTWGVCFGEPDASVFELTKCYRSTQPIARLCNAILPGGERLIPFGREGEMPLVATYSDALLKETLSSFRAAGHKSVAVITRTPGQADEIAEKLENVYRLDGEDADYEPGDTAVGCYHLMKGMEFDAVIACWPDCELTDDERRRLYAACSRALHAEALLGGEKLIAELGIVL